jgi:hypothetical protein
MAEISKHKIENELKLFCGTKRDLKEKNNNKFCSIGFFFRWSNN